MPKVCVRCDNHEFGQAREALGHLLFATKVFQPGILSKCKTPSLDQLAKYMLENRFDGAQSKSPSPSPSPLRVRPCRRVHRTH